MSDMASMISKRNELSDAERYSYSPDDFPGSKNWRINKAHADALAAFDAANPEVLAEVKAQRKAREAARYNALSDFAKMGS